MRGTTAKRLKRTAKRITNENQLMYVQHKNGRITIFWVGERRVYQELKKEWKRHERFTSIKFGTVPSSA